MKKLKSLTGLKALSKAEQKTINGGAALECQHVGEECNQQGLSCCFEPGEYLACHVEISPTGICKRIIM